MSGNNSGGFSTITTLLRSLVQAMNGVASALGTMGPSAAQQSPNLIYASPASGSGVAGFRAIAAADLAAVSQDKFYGYLGAAQSLAATFNTVALSATLFDTNSLFSAGNQGFVIKRTGYYQLHGQCSIQNTAASDFFISVHVNGNEVLRGTRGESPAVEGSHVSGVLYLTAGAVVTLGVYVGAAITTESGANIVYLCGAGPIL